MKFKTKKIGKNFTNANRNVFVSKKGKTDANPYTLHIKMSTNFHNLMIARRDFSYPNLIINFNQND